MRPITDRELLLQNLLATGASLLYRASQALGDAPLSEREAVIIEVETWFSETKLSLTKALAEDKPLPITKPVEAPALDWKKPTTTAALDFFLD